MVLQRKVGEMICAGREETRQEYRLRFAHTELNSTLFVTGEHITGRRDYCEQEETIDNGITCCDKYDKERKQRLVPLHNIQRQGRGLHFRSERTRLFRSKVILIK